MGKRTKVHIKGILNRLRDNIYYSYTDGPNMALTANFPTILRDPMANKNYRNKESLSLVSKIAVKVLL